MINHSESISAWMWNTIYLSVFLILASDVSLIRRKSRDIPYTSHNEDRKAVEHVSRAIDAS